MKRDFLDDAYLGSLCLELSLLVRAGVPFADGFLMLHDDDNDAASASLMKELSRLCENGAPLSAAFKAAGVFPEYLISALRVAEKTGRLEAALHALSEHYERQLALKKSLRNAVAYPAVLVLIMLGVVLALVFGVLPVFDAVFAQLGLTMPPLALFLMRLSRSVSAAVLILAGIGSLLALFLFALQLSKTLRSAVVRALRARFSRTKTGTAVARARFCNAMSMALASGLDTDEALSLVKTMFSGGEALKIDACAGFLREGKAFDDALFLSGLLGARDSRMAGLGVRTGAAEAAMADIAKRADAQAQERIDMLVARIEPALVAVTSVVIGGILLTVMLPLAGILSSIG
ncbi:MAG: type II secretion system F family protein [Clostridiaceae bacterium]